jgi:hypothetical protein
MATRASVAPGAFKPSAWLRWLGAMTFLAATVGFLVEGWTEVDGLRRQLSWSAVTLALTILGLFAARRFRDAAGARLFLGLAAATIPAHFAQGGAQIWEYATQGTTSLAAVVAESAALLLLAPLLCLGVSALVRGRGLLLTTLLFLLCSALLVPSRHGDVIAALALAEVGGLVLLELLVFRRDARLQTLEGAGARALLLTPPMILVVRNAFYDLTSLWVAGIVAMPSIVLLGLPHVARVGDARAKLLQSCGVAGLALASAIAVGEPELLALVVSVVGLLGAHVVRGKPALFAILGVAAFAINAIIGWLSPSTAYALLVVPIGTLHALSAFRARSAALLVASVVATLTGLVGQLVDFVRWPERDFWLLPAALGVAILVLASMLERHRKTMERFWLRCRSHFSDAGVGES